MPQVEITVGGRSFEVACQPGEEGFLRAAAEILDGEASALSSQIGRLPEGRMLLMSGLMLADKAAGLEDRVRELEARLAEEPPPPAVVAVEVVPPEALEALARLAAEAEALAETLESL